VGTPDPITGLAPIECFLNWAKPMDFGPLIGVACNSPSPGTCSGVLPAGQIDCDGGEPLDKTLQVFHDVGSCGLGDDPNETDPNNLSGPSDCAALCQDRCASLGGSFTVHQSGCEGYCRGGDQDGSQCTNDIECFANDPNAILTNSGECVGGEPVAHGNHCNCDCIELGGVPSRPGSFECQVELQSAIESNEPCDGTDVTLLAPTCSPFTTERIVATIFDADAMAGATVTAPALRGWPASCQQMAADNLGTVAFVADSHALDSALGDSSQPIRDECVGPGYDLSP
jgi:hypothetical protein